MNMNPHIAMLADGAILVAGSQKSRVISCLEGAVADPQFSAMLGVQAGPDDGFWPEPDSFEARYRPYLVVDGVLQIPVKGVLLHDFPYTLGNWATGYTYIERAFLRGCRDFEAGAIKGIALVCNTPGGMVAGCFDAVDKMVDAKAACGVPVRGFAHEMAYSAGYAIIAVADTIVVSRTGGVGSVGVVTSHIDWSKWNEQAGLKYTFIFAGKHKVDGNSEEPLPDDVKDRIKARIDELYEVFVSSVARNRGMDEQAIRDTEALTFTATQAVSNGFADLIGSLDDAMTAFAVDLSKQSGDDEMSTQDNSAAHEAAVTAARTEGHAAGLAEGVKTGAADQMTRINAILGSDAGKARPKAALTAALKSSMSADEATAFLAELPEEKPEQTDAVQGQSRFERGMENTPNPNVGAEGGGADGDGEIDVIALARQTGMNFVRPAAAA